MKKYAWINRQPKEDIEREIEREQRYLDYHLAVKRHDIVRGDQLGAYKASEYIGEIFRMINACKQALKMKGGEMR